MIFIPFPSTDEIANRNNSSILSGNFYIWHIVYPWRSYNQVIDVDLNAVNGSFNFLVLNWDAFSNWVNNLSFNSYYEVYNYTKLEISIKIEPPNQDELSLIIMANETLTYSCIIATSYLQFYTNWGGFSFFIGSIFLIYLVIKKYKKNLRLLY